MDYNYFLHVSNYHSHDLPRVVCFSWVDSITRNDGDIKMNDRYIHMTVADREKLLVKELQGKELTASELIDHIWNNMSDEDKVKVGWRFFVHLNKLFNILQKKNKIVQCGIKEGFNNRPEKIWRIT